MLHLQHIVKVLNYSVAMATPASPGVIGVANGHPSAHPEGTRRVQGTTTRQLCR
jgi:hypothetical protein